jgi:hypothetical protein
VNRQRKVGRLKEYFRDKGCDGGTVRRKEVQRVLYCFP